MRISLAEYLELTKTTQTDLADAVCLTQGAIHQMIKSGRSIFVVKDPDGTLRLEEVKQIGKAATA